MTSDRGVDPIFKPNWEVTERIEKEEKYVRFNKWCEENGVVAPSVRWPVAYGESGELIGVHANKDIGPCESYLYVPTKMTINEEQFRNSEIGKILEENEDEFMDRDHNEHYILIFFVAYQMSLGTASFWDPYFEISADSDLPMNWP